MITAQVAKSLKRTRTPLKQCTSRRSYTYKAEWTRSIEERENFWGERGQLLKWYEHINSLLLINISGLNPTRKCWTTQQNRFTSGLLVANSTFVKTP